MLIIPSRKSQMQIYLWIALINICKFMSSLNNQLKGNI